MISKYRAWNKITREMLMVQSIDFSMDFKRIISACLVDPTGPNISAGGYCEGAGNPDFDVKNLVFMPTTNYKDKYGDRFFQDDIVQGYYREQRDDKSKAVKVIGTVTNNKIRFMLDGFNLTEKCCCEITCVPSSSRCEIYWRNSGRLNIPDSCFCIEDIEIIGDIHSDPELLKNT